MTDETNTVEEVPQPPAPPAAPDETPEHEEPETDEEAPEGAGGDQETGQDSEGATDPTQGEEEAPAEPVVTNGPDGQTVTMPDGKVVTTRSHPYPVSNYEQEVFDLTHHGDQLRYPYVPGDPAYSAYSDPAVPNSHLAQRVTSEIAGFGERVKQDPNAAVSPMWNNLKGVEQGEIEEAIETGVSTGNTEL